MLGSYASAQLCEVNIDIPHFTDEESNWKSGMTQVTMGQVKSQVHLILSLVIFSYLPQPSQVKNWPQGHFPIVIVGQWLKLRCQSQ